MSSSPAGSCRRRSGQELGEDKLRAKIASLKSSTHVGPSGAVSITAPEIYEMQVQAIIEAACELTKEGVKVLPEIMIPLTGTKKEMAILTSSPLKRRIRSLSKRALNLNTSLVMAKCRGSFGGR